MLLYLFVYNIYILTQKSIGTINNRGASNNRSNNRNDSMSASDIQKLADIKRYILDILTQFVPLYNLTDKSKFYKSIYKWGIIPMEIR